MDFPVYIPLGPYRIHPHWLFEALAYFIGFRLYLRMRSKGQLAPVQALWLVVAAVLGAAAGSKVLFWMEDPLLTWRSITESPAYLMEGKTIVGGLLGGLLAVEGMKRRIGWTRRTGDDYAIPLIVGMIIGRVGCFLTGLDDHTYGTQTSWWTGIDFGDGVLRHPTQLYEITFLVLLLIALHLLRKRRTLPEGGQFQIFMLAYLLFRLLVDFIKPTPHLYLGLHAIQVACLLGLLHYIRLVAAMFRQQRKGVTPHA